MIFIVKLDLILLYLRETCCTLFFSFWNLFYLDIFLHEIHCMLSVKHNVWLFFTRKICCMVIYLKLVAYCFFYVKHNTCWFCSWRMLHMDCFFRKLNVSWFMTSRNVSYFYFFFMKLVACWFFYQWNLYIDFSPLETGFVRGSCSALIFARKAEFILKFLFVRLIVYLYILAWNLIFFIFLFVRFVHWFFTLETRFVLKSLLCADYCLWSLIYLVIFLYETSSLTVFSFVKLNLSWYFSSLNFLRVVFTPWNMMDVNFCLWKLLHGDYFYKIINVSWFMPSRNLLSFYFFVMKLFPCWLFSSWKLYLDFSPSETGFLQGTVACWFLFVKLNLSWCFSSWNF